MGRCLTRLINHFQGVEEGFPRKWECTGISLGNSITQRGGEGPPIGREGGRCLTRLVNHPQEGWRWVGVLLGWSITEGWEKGPLEDGDWVGVSLDSQSHPWERWSSRLVSH